MDRALWTINFYFPQDTLILQHQRLLCMIKKKGFIFLTILVLIPILLLLFGKATVYRFLAVTQRIDAPVLVIEGWVGQEGLEEALKEIQQHSYRKVIVAGLSYPFDSTYAYEVSGVGGLVFDLSQQTVPAADTLTVRAAGIAFQQVPARFSVWVNDSLIAHAYTSDVVKAYHFPLNSMTPHTVTIVFDNDAYEKGVGDRDLLVESVQLGNAVFHARMPNVRYDLGKIDGKRLVRTDFRSESEKAVAYLQSQGIADSLLTLITTPNIEYDRTYATAVAVAQWLKAHPDVPPVVHVFSKGVHARRSWLMYQEALGNDRNVGVIACRRKSRNENNWWETPGSRSYVMVQIAKYLYAKFFFWP